MNILTKCNSCACESVCKYKEDYRKAIEAISDAIISKNTRSDGAVEFLRVKDCPHVEVSVKCPHMITQSSMRG